MSERREYLEAAARESAEALMGLRLSTVKGDFGSREHYRAVRQDVLAALTHRLGLVDGFLPGPLKDVADMWPEDLTSDEVRLIHEILLDLVPKLGDPSQLQQNSVERKGFGAYFTPKEVARELAEWALEPLLERFERAEASEPYEKLCKDFKVFDPSMGTGMLLDAARETIVDRMTEIRELDANDPLRDELRNLVHRDVLHGVDLDAAAVQTTRLALRLRPGKPSLSDPGVHFWVADALRDLVPMSGELLETAKARDERRGTFQAVLLNPPYLPWWVIRERRPELLRRRFGPMEFHARPSHKDAHPNAYLFHLVLALELLAPGGRLAAIVPQEWREESKAAPFRDYLEAACRSIKLHVFAGDAQLFSAMGGPVGTNSLLLFAERGEGPAKVTVVRQQGETQQATQESLGGKDDAFSDFFDLLPEEVVPLRDGLAFAVGGGHQPPVDELPDFTFSREELGPISEDELSFLYPALSDAKNIRRYRIEPSERFWAILNPLGNFDYAREKAPKLLDAIAARKNISGQEDGEWWKFPNVRRVDEVLSRQPKLLTPRTAEHNSFALDENKGYQIKGTNSWIRPRGRHSVYFLLAVLNSSVLDEAGNLLGRSYHGGGHRLFTPAELGVFPIRDIDFPETAQENDLRTKLWKKWKIPLGQGKSIGVRREIHRLCMETNPPCGSLAAVHDVLEFLARQLVKAYRLDDPPEQLVDFCESLIDDIVRSLYRVR